MTFTQAEIWRLEEFLWVDKSQNQYEEDWMRKIQKYCWVFRYIPGLLLVWVGNSIAMKSAHKNSDIDVLVVTKKDALWLVRVVMTCIVMVTGNRKTSKKHAGKICLSFFSTEEGLDFSKIAFEKDIYLYYRTLTMKPILTKWEIYKNFMSSNSWIDFENNKNIHRHHNDYLKYELSNHWELNYVIRYTDKLCKKLLLRRSIKKYEALWKPEWVIISDIMLKFHDKDRRKYIREKVLEKS